MSEQESEQGQAGSAGVLGATQVTSTKAADKAADKGAASSQPKNLDFILDIPMQVSVQLGTTQMLIRELLQLGQGSVVELEKLAGEPMEVLVNNKLVARGEVVVVNEKFGIRLTDVISAEERIQQLA